MATKEKIARWLDKYLGWHVPDPGAHHGFDGCSFYATCKYCGKPILQDSQGNWFTNDFQDNPND